MHPADESRNWSVVNIDPQKVDRMEVHNWLVANKTGKYMSFPVMDTSDYGMHFQYRFENESDTIAFKLTFEYMH